MFFPVGANTNVQAEEDRVNARVNVLMQLALQENIEFWSNEQRCRAIVLFQDRATQGREQTYFSRGALAMVYNAMFPRNPQPDTMEKLMKLFCSPANIHDFVKAQMVAGTKFALVWVRIHYPKIDLDQVAEGSMLTHRKNRLNIDKHNEAVTAPALKMIDRLLEADQDFFVNYRYDASTREMRSIQKTIDRYF
jgi:hypothetical protein